MEDWIKSSNVLQKSSILPKLHDLITSLILRNIKSVLLSNFLSHKPPTNELPSLDPFHQRLRRTEDGIDNVIALVQLGMEVLGEWNFEVLKLLYETCVDFCFALFGKVDGGFVAEVV
ncbi:hypothetical protein AC579_2703 [Pseudocercospora musae]|uniref:Uncharacterized protein n=1 Tax=Pseudocercospora musae TaxID=113226 RepID=A0A139IVP7_9PEZI|nr:hypothetical protein AC579_2703 [Pseudocercospora musae]